MRVLALDTATEACSVALLDGEDVTTRFEVAGRSHTQQLAPMVAALLSQAGLVPAQLDTLVCGVGPGSFAGVRIGVGFTKGLALALDRPVLGVSSLAMLAQGAIEQGAVRVLSAIDARMDEVYIGAFAADARGLATPLDRAVVTAPGHWRFSLPGLWHACGTGWRAYADVLQAAVADGVERTDAKALPRAEHGLHLALPRIKRGEVVSAAELEPVYLRDKVALTVDEQRARREGKAD